MTDDTRSGGRDAYANQPTSRDFAALPETVKDRQGIVYDVTYAKECKVNKTWTHYLGLKRPKGQCAYMLWVRINEAGKIVGMSNTVKAF